MADLLIKHLKEKAEEHSALDMLVNQWGFDEKLIPKALQTIGSLFPHYSRHDESHSKQILINIERLLGNKNISKLTATDTWLLLEAAYWHDIGMVVPQKDIEDAFEDQKFQQYIAQIRNSPNHSLHKFCISFDAQNINKCFSGADTPLDAMDKLRQLMAEWFRMQHADRAKEIIQAPWESVGLSSPRTELIPTRLFKLLGRICHTHGLPFKNLINPNGLPYREAGLAQEDCHPRFVACLLRMGDLLDLDDNRFCPVMQRIAGDNRPLTSKAHEDKHAGIRHLRVDRERIEISAECESVDGYLETFKWFDWLKQEIQNQMAHWQDIVPSREFGLLPTLGTIQVNLSGEQQLLAEGQKPQFSIDGEQATALLQGDNLYSTKFSCIRELLQNAVDATLLQLWLTKITDEKDWTSPLSKVPKETFKKSPVTITLAEDNKIDTPKDKTAWILTITDTGTGISRNDLNHMLKIGGSKKNTFRQEKITNMPEWMKPSGTFGIGFQSVFMICDEVKITTKDMFYNEIMEIIMHSPTGLKEGLVTIKVLEEDFSRSFGTTLEVSFILDKKSSRWSLPSKWNFSSSDKESISDKLVNTYDPMLDETFPFEATTLVEKIQIFSEYSMIPIEGNFRTESLSYPFNDFDKKTNTLRFIEVDKYQLLLDYKPLANDIHNNFSITFRGQPFKQKLHFLRHISVRMDLLSGKAGKWLTIDRENLLAAAEGELKILTLKGLKKKIELDLASVKFSSSLNSDERIHLSFFLQQMSLQDNSWNETSKKLGDAWYDLQFGSNEETTYRKLAKKKEWIISTAISDQNLGITPSEDEKGCDLLIPHGIGSHERYEMRFLLIKEWLKVSGNTVKILESSHYDKAKKQLRYKLSNKKQQPFSKKALATELMLSANYSFYNVRYLVPFETEKWKALYIKQEEELSGVRELFMIPHTNKSFVLLPFLFLYTKHKEDDSIVRITPSELDKLVKWIQPRLEKESSFEKIREKYNELIDYIDNDIMKTSPFWEEWKKARGIKS